MTKQKRGILIIVSLFFVLMAVLAVDAVKALAAFF